MNSVRIGRNQCRKRDLHFTHLDANLTSIQTI